MAKVYIKETAYSVAEGTLLSEFLQQNGFAVSHPCGGRGSCGKCLVRVNGKEEKSCRYRIQTDITVELPEAEAIYSPLQQAEGEASGLLALDLGTTTLALAEVSAEGTPLRAVSSTNPQRRFGADVIARIEYCQKNDPVLLQQVLLEELAEMLKGKEGHTLYVAGNTTMLHLLFGVDPTPMGAAPYTPAFLAQRQSCSLPLPVERVISLPGIAAFVGADIVAGLLMAEAPAEGHYNLLVDLGTNAEIVLFSRETALCTAAAAGPCFEGANISCGMSASRGAVCSYNEEGYRTVGDAPAVGLCGTGLIDLIATLVKEGTIDETGYMEEDFEIAPAVRLTPADVRCFQLAKSAVCAAILTLMERAGVTTEQIDTLYLCGGFSAAINRENAAAVGLFPAELCAKASSLGNSSLGGTARYACGAELPLFVKNAEYADLSADPVFSDLFMENMMF